MNRYRHLARHRANGSVAVEFAALLPVLILLTAGVLFLGRVFWNYTVAQKAAHDAVAFLASAPGGEFRIQGPSREAPVAVVAREIAFTETAESNLGDGVLPGVTVACDGGTCTGAKIPTRLLVRVDLPITDPFFPTFTGDDEILLYAVATMNYADN
jgi:hypothetical protein